MSKKRGFEELAIKARGLKTPKARHAAADAAVADFNDRCPVGTVVRYWTGVREGNSAIGTVRAPAENRFGVPVVWVTTHAAYIAMTHVEYFGLLAELEELSGFQPLEGDHAKDDVIAIAKHHLWWFHLWSEDVYERSAALVREYEAASEVDDASSEFQEPG